VSWKRVKTILLPALKSYWWWVVGWVSCDYNVSSDPFVSELRLWEWNLEIWAEMCDVQKPSLTISWIQPIGILYIFHKVQPTSRVEYKISMSWSSKLRYNTAPSKENFSPTVKPKSKSKSKAFQTINLDFGCRYNLRYWYSPVVKTKKWSSKSKVKSLPTYSNIQNQNIFLNQNF